MVTGNHFQSCINGKTGEEGRLEINKQKKKTTGSEYKQLFFNAYL